MKPNDSQVMADLFPMLPGRPRKLSKQKLEHLIEEYTDSLEEGLFDVVADCLQRFMKHGIVPSTYKTIRG